jgi:hypothetical protein
MQVELRFEFLNKVLGTVGTTMIPVGVWNPEETHRITSN